MSINAKSGDGERSNSRDMNFDKDDSALCDEGGCEELARYVETGDGEQARDPRRRCHKHKPDTGLWRDIAWSVARSIHMNTDES